MDTAHLSHLNLYPLDESENGVLFHTVPHQGEGATLLASMCAVS